MKGFIKTLEGALSIFILFAFIFYVIPHVPAESRVGEPARNFAARAFENLDKAGVLDDYLVGNVSNLSAVDSALGETIPSDFNYTVGVMKANASYGTVFSEELYNGTNISYSANFSYFRRGYLSLSFFNATNPRVYVNGEEVFSYDGVCPAEPLRLDVTGYSVDGANNIEVRTLNNATVEYVLIIENEEVLAPVPNDRAVAVVTYIISGKEGLFCPTVAEIFLWKWMTI